MATNLTCPLCRKVLLSKNPITAKELILCPGCKETFRYDAVEVEHGITAGPSPLAPLPRDDFQIVSKVDLELSGSIKDVPGELPQGEKSVPRTGTQIAAILFWCLSLAAFLASLLLGGWAYYLWGMFMTPVALGSLISGNVPGQPALLEVFLILTWLANPFCHIATLQLWPSWPEDLRFSRTFWPRIFAGVAFSLALSVCFLEQGQIKIANSTAYWTWVSSMGLMFLAALCPARPARVRSLTT